MSLLFTFIFSISIHLRFIALDEIKWPEQSCFKTKSTQQKPKIARNFPLFSTWEYL